MNRQSETKKYSMSHITIDDFKDEKLPVGGSRFVEPMRLTFNQNGTKRVWDMVKSHPSVAILIHNIDQKALVLVKQFRPPVYMARMWEGSEKPDAVEGVTLELCAGIIDKDLSYAEIAAEEVFEETGYRVKPGDLEKIVECRHNVGLLGVRQVLYYVEVRDAQREGTGGGSEAEAEFIEVVHEPVANIDALMADSTIAKPAGLLFALVWLQRRMEKAEKR